jgi:hypothetical protein
MSYIRKSIDLTAAQASTKEITGRDLRVTEVTIIRFVGQINLHFGADADPIAIDGPISFKPEGSDQTNGLFFTNDLAQPGVACVMYISFAGGLNADLRV